MNLIETLFKNKTVLGAVGARAFAVVSSFLMVSIVSRTLSTAEAGAFFVIMALTVTGSTIGRWGTDTVALKASAANELTTRALIALVRICATRALVVAVTIPSIALGLVLTMHRDESYAAVYLAMACAVWTGALAVLAGSALRGFGRISQGIVVETALAPALTLFLVALSPALASLSGVVTAYALGNAISLMVGTALLARTKLSERGTFVLKGRQFELSLFAMAGTSTLFYLLTWAPVITLGTLGLTTEAAYYTVAARLANLINLVPILQNSYIAPLIARAASQRNIPEIGRISTQAARRAALIAAPAAAFFASSPWIVNAVFGAQYEGAVPAMRILVLAAAITISFGPVNPVMLTSNHETLAMSLSAVLLLATIGGVTIGALLGGTTGVALASGGTLMAYAAAASRTLLRRDGIATAAWRFPARGQRALDRTPQQSSDW